MTATRDPHRAIRKLNLVGLVAIVVGMGGVGGWAATTRLAGAVIASGTVIVESNVKKVQHLSGGIVGDIFVKEGSEVEAGQVLVRLDDTLTRANLGVVQNQLDQFVAREARLMAERDGEEEIIFPESLTQRLAQPEVGRAVNGEDKLLQSRRSARDGQRSQLKERIDQTRNEVVGLTAQLEAKEHEVKFVTEEFEGVEDLYKRNLVTIVRYMQLRRDKARLEGERGLLTAEISRARGKIAETELQILQLDQEFRTEVLKDLREAQSRVAELKERFNAAQDELNRVSIRAPQSGIVHQLAAHTVGGVIARGDPVMLIVPKEATLVVEAKVAPTDVDQVIVGAKVAVRVAAGNRRTTPDLNGTVMYISPDLTRDTQPGPMGTVPQQPHYNVRISLPDSEVERLDGFQLVPGMQAEVYIHTDDRTPFNYLLKPLQEQIARTFRER